MQRIGSKAQVYHQTALQTSGGLKRSDLMKTKKGRIVSKKQHAAGKKAIKRLFSLGYKPKKGTFKVMRKHKKGTRKHSRKNGGAYGSVSSESFETAGYGAKAPVAK